MDYMPLNDIMDSKKFSRVSDDPSQSLKTEGGYEYTRPKYTRRPRRNWTIGFTNLKPEEYNELNDFYDKMMGGSQAFVWIEPTTKEEVTVRFVGQINWTYMGVGPTVRWNTASINIREV